MGATQSSGGGSLRQSVLRKELIWHVGGTTGGPECLRTVSRGWEGAGLQAVGRGPEVGWKPWMVQSRGGIWSDVGVKSPLMVTGGVTAEAVTRFSKAEETAV